MEDLVKILDLNNFQLREDKFKQGEEDKCESSKSWKALDKINKPKEYIEELNKIKTNPRYESFIQIYFHAGDIYQFQKYALLKSRLLNYPSNPKSIKGLGIYNGYNLNTTYNTFLYLFDKLKKGIYVSIKDNKLDIFLPFSNIGYKNNWSDVLEKINPKLMGWLKSRNYNVKDPSHWYANNCILNTNKYKFSSDRKDYIVEGDKTEVPFKYFLTYFLENIKKNGKKLDDVDFFFSPRDFPVFRKNNLEPYVNLLGNKKLEDEYIHDTYTPILSQCGKKDFYDIPVPTEDDMMRITKDIYPDTCKNNYSKDIDFEIDWSDKIDKCVFRGSATGCGITINDNMRLRLAYLSVLWDKKNILDAKLTGPNKKPKVDESVKSFGTIRLNEKGEFIHKGVHVKIGKQNFMKLEEQSKHKYILNIDGHVKAFRFGNELRMGSVILLVDSPYTLWFQNKLKPYEHYVPVKSDLSDLEKQINWCKQNDDKCEQIAKHALDFYNKYLSKQGTYDYFYNLLNDLGSIRKKPDVKKLSDNKLNIIVSYRDPGDGYRERQLNIFKDQMKLIFDGKIDYHIYIIEQESVRDNYDKLPDEYKQSGTKMAKFNLGMLKNIGFIIANKENNKIQNAYYVLSDVDLLPSEELIKDYLRFPDTPIHLGNKGTRYNIKDDDDKFLGGVLSVNSDDFLKCNGYPNNFWGWGGEDNALKQRLDTNNLDIQRPEGSVIDLEEMTIKEKMQDLKDKDTREKNKLEKLCSDSSVFYEKYKNIEYDGKKIQCDNLNNWDKNGLNTIEDLYKIVNKEQYGGGKNISHYKVELKIPGVSLSDDKITDKTSTNDLYRYYNECQVNINTGINVSENESTKLIIKEILDNRDLDDDQMKILEERDYLTYPDHNDPSFVNKISEKAEFYVNKINFNKENLCGNKEFELANHQRLLKNFVNNNTPYRSLLLFHGVGVGKTCTGVTISESFRDIYTSKNKKIIIVRKSGLSQGWQDTIFDSSPDKLNNQCSGDTFLNIAEESNLFDKQGDSLKRSTKKLIKNYYEFYQYGTFSGMIKRIIGKTTDEDIIKMKIKEYFSNRLLIVDEYHNLREETESLNDDGSNEVKTALQNLKKVLMYSENLRVIFLTATPMFNNAKEIFQLLNLMLLNDKRPLINEKDYIDRKTGKINSSGVEIINKKCRGYISYLRGENPINFPLRLHPNDNKDSLTILPSQSPKKDMFGKTIDEKLKFLITYKDELQGYQKEIYRKYLEKIIEKKGDQEEIKIGIDKQLPQICNIVYPSDSDDKDYGESGFNEVFSKSGKKFKYKSKQILKLNEISDYSIKFKNVLDNILSSEGIIFIYTDYIWSGAVPIGIALEHLGFNKYNNKNFLQSGDIDEPLSYDMKKHRKDYKDKKDFKQANYIILSADDRISGDNDRELKILQSPENKNGELVKVIIGSSITGEGMDFKNIREIHVLEPWYHLNKLEQIVGRGIRFCSHSGLEQEKRNVTVYLHTALCDGNETTDHYNYRRGERKSIEIGKVESILKKNALDCYLFKEGNVIKKKDVLPVKVITSKKKRKNKSIYDEPYTKICSFQKSCNYDCNGVDETLLDKLDEDTLNYDTFDVNNFTDITKNITKYINELFKNKNYFSLDDIVEHIQYHKKINKYIIYNSIKDIIDNKITIYNKNKNKGYIICRNDTYIFQPLLNNDESIPLYYRNPISNNINKINIEDIKIEEYIPATNQSSVTNTTTILPITKFNHDSIVDDIIKDFENLKKDKILNHFIKLNGMVKIVLVEYLLDRLKYNERKEYIKYLILDKKDLTFKNDLNLTDEEVDLISYKYFAYNFIYEDGMKDKLFKLDGEPNGFFIVNNLTMKEKGLNGLKKSIEFYLKDGDNFNTQSGINLKQKDYIDNENIRCSKPWAYTYLDPSNINKKDNVYLKIVDDKLPGWTPQKKNKGQLIDKIKPYFAKLDGSININLSKIDDLYDRKIKFSESDISFLIEILFRLQDKYNLNKKVRFFINYDLMYYKFD